MGAEGFKDAKWEGRFPVERGEKTTHGMFKWGKEAAGSLAQRTA